MGSTISTPLAAVAGSLFWPLRLIHDRRNDEVRDHLYLAYKDAVAQAEAAPRDKHLARQVESLARALSDYDKAKEE